MARRNRWWTPEWSYRPPSGHPSKRPCGHVNVIEVVGGTNDLIPLNDDIVRKCAQLWVFPATEDAKHGPGETSGDDSGVR